MTENAMIDRIDEYKSRRKKRKLRRIAFALFFTGFAVLLSWFFESQVTTTVIIATHAELETDLSSNSGLSSQGMERASQINSRGRHRVASYLADEEGMLRVSREAAVEQPVAQYRPGETIVKQLVAATVRAALDFRWL